VQTQGEPPEIDIAPAGSEGENLRRIEQLEARVRDLTRQVEAQQGALDGHGGALLGHASWLSDLQKWMTSTVQIVGTISTVSPTTSARLDSNMTVRLTDPLVQLERKVRIWVVTSFLALSEVPEDLTISVIVPTKNRRSLVARAIASVEAQTYSNWELLVIDDASKDDTSEWLAALSEPRVRALRGPGQGPGAARNVGLDAAAGDIVTYLDDDNIMHPGWLKAVAWAFSRWTDTESLYGARILENDRTSAMAGGAFPSLEFRAYDRQALERAGFIDQNVLAHRRGIPGSHQDTALSAAHDWDVALKLTGRRPPLELPVVACLYCADASGRLSETTKSLASTRLIRARVHTTRPFRLLAHGEHTPTWPGGNIGNVLHAWCTEDAAVAICGGLLPDMPPDQAYPRFAAIRAAVEEFKPDLLVLFDTGTARRDIDTIDDLGVPFVLSPGQDVSDQKDAAAIRSHPLCAGVLPSTTASPSHADLSEALTHWRLQNS
jgi:glycosyltransferase involved in cell wall biosynthesis